MKYYVVSDIHGFYTELHSALKEKGFFDDTIEHKLIICGDLFDRGKEALKLQEFILELMDKDEVILIKGNHEDLILDLVNTLDNYSFKKWHHIQNGSVNTILQLCEVDHIDESNMKEIKEKMNNSDFFKRIIPNMINYYETNNYIFVHGWIPCWTVSFGGKPYKYEYMEDWREAEQADWYFARWYNGMDAAYQKVIEENKTIVCGHWHASYGHSRIEGKGSEYESDADYSPFVYKGIIAIDARTAVSRKINCLVIED